MNNLDCSHKLDFSGELGECRRERASSSCRGKKHQGRATFTLVFAPDCGEAVAPIPGRVWATGSVLGSILPAEHHLGGAGHTHGLLLGQTPCATR